MTLFANRKIAIATKHKKEEIIAPMLYQELFAIPILAEFDTDELGTFSGEIERNRSPYEAAKAKCLKAMELSGSDVAIASEGSFGPHPSIPFISADDELILLVDRINKIEFFAREVSTRTNFSGEYIHSLDELKAFCERVHFPSHALILKDVELNFSVIHKGIQNEQKLKRITQELLDENGKIWLETDMRSMHNPMRREVIKAAMKQLILKLKSACPNCDFPGFWITDSVKGLKCSLCGLPTQSTLAHKYECKKCSHEEIREFPYSKTEEDPMYCDFCNP